MGNLARKQRQEVQRKAVRSSKENREHVRKFRISLGEKVLGIIFCAVFCFVAVHIISNQAEIYELNKDIQKTTATITEQKRINNDLSVQVGELSTYERIWTKAKEMGLKLNENNVKVVQE